MTQKRVLVLCCGLLLAFCVLLCRLFWVSTDSAYAASAQAQTLQQVEMPKTRGNFYDRNGRRLTGAIKQWYALCLPGDSSYTKLFPYISYKAQATLYRQRNSSSMFLLPVTQDLTAENIYTYAGVQRYLPLPVAVHLIGYLDGEGHGVAGLERAYDDILYAEAAPETIACTTTAQGSLPKGTTPQVSVQPRSSSDIKLTLDANIQRACEGIAQNGMQKGCIVVMQAQTGELLASVSMPEFQPDNVAQSIAADDTSLIDRPLASFDAGSVFKVVLAAAAYKAGLSWFESECTGEIAVGDQNYRCALSRAHGMLNLRTALQQSCNCYFIALGQKLGATRILQAAQAFGFGSYTALAPGLKSETGVLPETETLQSEGQRAMFSFGQGQLTVTPLQVTAMMNAIANGGTYRPATLVKSITGQADPPAPAESHRVCTARTAAIVRDMLVSVITEGIGGEAQPGEGQAGGKTGTAQTGRYDENGEELLNHWFAGFYPAESPAYTITVLQDGIVKPQYSSAALFAQVANALYINQNG